MKTGEKFIRKEPKSLEEAVGTARAYAAAANATGNSLSNNFDAMAISVCEPRPAWNVSDSHGRPPNCVYCQRFGSAAQRCGHNSPSPMRSPRSRTYWPLSRRMNRGFTTPPGRSHDTLVSFVPSIACPNSQSLLFCSVGLNGCSSLTILDNGAACSLVCSRFCPEIRPHQRELRTANGTVLQAKGSARVKVTIGNRTVAREACVSDAIPWDGIIRPDVLVKTGCTIDVQRRILRISGENVKLPPSGSLAEERNPEL
ncbi:hypothetical protein P879_11915 [Paragonimus westermani]|uniref:Peptidase A2 domain-containing protein n=1 Tax=Paragonimus westermani TaxID=34504 RepID=A0A8T0D6U7_9TREM|nr:hypothetical protein P879_11915 [Paragonimus westermani]